MSDVTQHFSGSYRQEDVEFLLTPMALEPILDLAEKERLIQSGQRHYSEMLSPESLPSPAYLALFQSAFAANRLQTLPAEIAQMPQLVKVFLGHIQPYR